MTVTTRLAGVGEIIMRVAVVAAVLCLSALNLSAVSNAQAAVRQSTNIAPQGLGPALQLLAKAHKFQLVYRSEFVKDLRTQGAVGDLTPDQALTQLLSGTGLAFRYLDDRTVTVFPASSTDASPTSVPPAAGSVGDADESGSSDASSNDLWQRLRLAQNDQAPQEADSSSRTEGQRAVESHVTRTDEQVDLGEVIVTGTRIKGMKDQFSPVTRIGREEMDLAGHTNVADVFNSLPQNFGGGIATDTVIADAAAGSGGTGVNLRGLGNEATLVLLNGRRLAPGGAFGDFVDISSIPVSAIDRIEIMTDGASAIYGTDAIAGVVNIILRKEFSGAESRLNFGAIDDGGGDTVKLGQTVGFSSDRAHGLLTYEYSSEDELDANDKDFAAVAVDPTYLLPYVRKNSVFGSAGAELSQHVGISADGYYNRRDSKGFTSRNVNSLQQFYQEAQVEQLGGGAGVEIGLFGDWQAEVSGAYSESVMVSEVRQLNAPANSPNAIGDRDAESSVVSADLSIGGSLLRIAGESVRSMFGVHYRTENFDTLVRARATGVASHDVDKSRNVFAAYGELYAPLISGSNARPGIERLAFTVAARYDDYSDAGSTFDPKVGVLWSPLDALNIRATYGTAFRVARLEQVRGLITAANLGVYVDPQAVGGQSVALQVSGYPDRLDPEEATAFTIGFDLAPAQLQGFRVRGTYFDIDYDGRIGSPGFTFGSALRFTNFTGLPIRNPSQATVQNLVANARTFLDISTISPTLGDLELTDVTVILDTRPQNTVASRIEGFDLEAIYSRPSNSGDWTFTFNATSLTGFEQQFSPLTVVENLVDTFANPVDVKLRAGVTRQTALLTGALYVNYVDDYTDDEALGGAVPIESWTTLDASMRIELGKVFAGTLAQGAQLSFSVTNLFNQNPPALGRATGRFAVYDSANADPGGRRFGMLLTKKW